MIEKLIEKLDNINQTLERILSVMQKPENKFVKGLRIFGLVVGALGILYFIDMVRNWIIGG